MLRQAQPEFVSVELPLACHPDTPSRAISGVIVSCGRAKDRLLLRYRVAGDVERLALNKAAAVRTDELWRHTCFEAFVAANGPAYREFNLAPSGAWAAYAFAARRTGMTDAEAVLMIDWHGAMLTAEIEVPIGRDWRVNLTAVIEERDGTKSYWALAHPDGPPDFHDPACFVLELPAPA